MRGFDNLLLLLLFVTLLSRLHKLMSVVVRDRVVWDFTGDIFLPLFAVSFSMPRIMI